MKQCLIKLCGSAFLLAACSEAEPPADVSRDSQTIDASDVSIGADSIAPDAPTTDASTDTTMMADEGGGIVVNEMAASGGDWVELFNTGLAAVDVSNHGVADREDDGGVRVARAVRFPTGTVVPGLGYLVVMGNIADAGAGVQTACGMGGPPTCFHATWGVGSSAGDTISFVSPTDQVLAQGVYPPNAVPSGQTWGRLPNGNGAFVANSPTIGAANRAP